MPISFDTIQSIAAQKHYVKHNYFRPKSSPLLYAHFRVMRPILKLNNKRLLRKWKDAPIPWMTPAAIDIINAILTPDLKGFEFGSGRSTLFIAPRVEELVSLEHDVAWYQYISEELMKRSLNNVHYFLKPPASEPSKTIGYPKNNYINYTMPRIPATCYTEYAAFIDQYEDEEFDFIIIDGRARVECTQHAIPKLKKGGVLILDNAERNRYASIHTMLRNWKSVFTTSGITDTVFWIKP